MGVVCISVIYLINGGCRIIGGFVSLFGQYQNTQIRTIIVEYALIIIITDYVTII